ncbi:MAG TPA: FAD-dependent oxidoreductase, partial [Dehalococcoidia bacterium]|nr:FAD-dependent oxidoreductase [Dehalococcoidia bacterium]
MSDDKKVGAALVIGGGVGGMQAALDLAEAGIKTYILDEKTSIGGAMVQLDKTFPTNDCAMCTIAPRLVGIGRHLNIEVITNAEIDEVRGSAGNFAVKVKKRARYIDLSKCTGCAACVEKCPIEVDNDFDQGLIKRNAIYRRYPQAVPSAFAIDKDGKSPCRIACPAGVNPHAYIALFRTGRKREAYELIKSALPFPGICGRVCHHPCEKECYRGKLLDEPIAICALKRFIADTAAEGWAERKPPVAQGKGRVAVIGAGPAGLTCARDLAWLGYEVTIFDSQPYAGGMMRRAIPRYRLSADLVDKEVGEIFTDGIVFRPNTTVGKDISFAELRKGFDSIFIAVGAGLSRTLPRLPGIELQGVMLALPFLEDINKGERPDIGDKVVIVGGGNVAMDVARSALRAGAKEANVVCLESWEEMLCHPWEREEAVEEGVKIHNSLGPKRVIGENGRVRQIEFLRVESIFDKEGRFNPTYLPGTESVFECDTVIIAIGQASELGFLDGSVELTPGGWIKVDPLTLETSVPGVFAGGDAVKGPTSIVEAVGAGHNAAISIDRFLSGKDIAEGRGAEAVVAPEPETEGLARQSRVPTKRLEPERRKANFEEVVSPLTEEEALAEAERCLACAKCCECRECEKACEAKAIDHEVEREDVIELNVGAIVVAPGFELLDPSIKKELGYGRFPNVITSLQFERMLSANGPFSGHIVRPSDNRKPQKIAFIQCVGSREIDMNYCSAVCCMYATKEAIIAKEHHPELDIKIFYIDLRAFGKGFEAYYERAKSLGVEYIRCRPSEIKEVPATRELKIRYLNGQGEVAVECFDMVVLCCGLRPSAKAEELARKLGVRLNSWGFCETEPFSPAETSREGIFACGVFTEPKDIPETVTQGSAAAAKVLSFLSAEKGQLIRTKTYPPERDVSGQEPRIGVFICHCGNNIAGVVDVPELVNYVKTLPDVFYVESNLYTCSTDTGEKIKQVIREQGLNRLIVASCTPRTHEPLFQDTLREAGLNPYLFEMANIRDQCSWVHMHEPEAATKKAKDLIRMAVAKARLLEPLYPQFVDVIPRALVIGGGMAGMTA